MKIMDKVLTKSIKNDDILNDLGYSWEEIHGGVSGEDSGVILKNPG